MPQETITPKEIQKSIFDAPLQFYRPQQSSEAVDLLRSLVENSTFLSGTTYGIDERHIEKASQFLKRLTD